MKSLRAYPPCPHCGGKLRGHGRTTDGIKAIASRLRCKACLRAVTWRDEQFSTLHGRRHAVKEVELMLAVKPTPVIRAPIHPFVLGLAA